MKKPNIVLFTVGLITFIFIGFHLYSKVTTTNWYFTNFTQETKNEIILPAHSLVDTISYNLPKGKYYTVIGKIYDVTSNKYITKNNSIILTSLTFRSEGSGTINLIYNLDEYEFNSTNQYIVMSRLIGED